MLIIRLYSSLIVNIRTCARRRGETVETLDMVVYESKNPCQNDMHNYVPDRESINRTGKGESMDHAPNVPLDKTCETSIISRGARPTSVVL